MLTSTDLAHKQEAMRTRLLRVHQHEKTAPTKQTRFSRSQRPGYPGPLGFPGYIECRNNSWTLRFCANVVRKGRVQVSKTLARVGPKYPTRESVVPLARKLLVSLGIAR